MRNFLTRLAHVGIVGIALAGCGTSNGTTLAGGGPINTTPGVGNPPANSIAPSTSIDNGSPTAARAHSRPWLT